MRAVAPATGPIIGVVDGSDAKPGEVGEWHLFTQVIAVPVTYQVTPVGMGVVPPGDWDCSVFAEADVFVSALGFYLGPTAGVSGALSALSTPVGGNLARVNSSIARLLVSVPTLVVLNLESNNLAGGSAGNVTATLTARRMR